MKGSPRVWIFVSLVVMSVLAGCGGPLPGMAPRVDPVEATMTMVVLSTQVEGTRRALDQESGPAPEEHDQPSPAETQEPESQEPVPQATDTPTPVPTTAEPVAHVLENTNCRTGPGTVYDLRHIALSGDVLPVVASSTVSDYVLVQDPSHPGEVCWLWTRYVELRGDQSGLPVRTPPPTPTPSISFSIVYDYMDGCVGWDPAFQVTNTGGVTFRSYYIEAYDTVADVTKSVSVDNFDETSGCPVVTSIPELNPGMTGWVHAYSFHYDPTGNPLQVTVTLCTEIGLGGTCITQNLTVTP